MYLSILVNKYVIRYFDKVCAEIICKITNLILRFV